MRMRINEPLALSSEQAQKVNFKIKVEGGGVSSKADAIRVALPERWWNTIQN